MKLGDISSSFSSECHGMSELSFINAVLDKFLSFVRMPDEVFFTCMASVQQNSQSHGHNKEIFQIMSLVAITEKNPLI
ncbi:hypothetical protein D3C85_1498190 [compost metagenome]